MKKTLSILVLIILIAAGGYYFYQTQHKSTENTDKKPEKEVIKVGAILPLTGKLAIIGEPEKNAISIFNDRFKIFQFHIKDFKGRPVDALSSFNQIISTNPDIDLYFASTSNACNVLKPKVIKENKILFANTSLPGITDGKNLFRIAPNTEQEIKIIIDSLLPENSSHVIFYPNNELGLKIKNIFINNSKNFNQQFESFDIGERNYRNLLQKIPDSIQTIVFEGYPSDIPIFLKQLKESNKNIKMVILSMAALWLPEKILKNYNFDIYFPGPKVYFSYLDNKKLNNETLEILIKSYTHKYQKQINYDVLFVWETLNFIKTIGISDNKIEPNIIREKWKGTYNGLLGSIKLLKNGDVIIPLKIRHIRG